MKRRSFLAGITSTIGGLVLPYEPKVIYSFPTLKRPFAFDDVLSQLEESSSYIAIYSGTPLGAPLGFVPQLLAQIPLSGKDWVVKEGVARLAHPVSMTVDYAGYVGDFSVQDNKGRTIASGPLEVDRRCALLGDEIKLKEIVIKV